MADESINEMYPAFPYLSEKYGNNRNNRKDFNPLDYKEAYLMLMQNMKPDTDREIHEQEFLNWFNIDPNSEEFKDRKNRLLRLLSNMPQGGFGYESAEEHWAEKTEQGSRIDTEKAGGGIVSLNQMTRPIGYR